jgi:outer membrane protein assembly factor BamE (lipoprotein component of BamABCDE complex)
MAICRGINLVVLGSVLMAAAACLTTSGNKTLIQPDVIDQIQEGQANKTEVRRLLGEPGLIQGCTSTSEVWFYNYKGLQVKPLALTPVFGNFTQQGEVKEASLSLTFDRQGIVQRKEWEVSTGTFPREPGPGDNAR